MVTSSIVDFPLPSPTDQMLSSSCEKSHWYLVYVKSREENIASVHLDRLGLQTFCPRLKQEKIIRRVRREVVVPFFPGYVFVKFDPMLQFRAVQYSIGVRKIVTFGDTLARVDSSIIETLRERMTKGCVHVPNSSSFQPGQKVRIQEGPLQGFEAVFECEMSDRQRVTLLLKTVAYQARVIVPVEQIANPS